MNTKIDTVQKVSTRDFLRNFKSFKARAGRGEHFAVMTNKEEAFRVEPPKVKRKKKYTMDDLLSIKFNGPKNLSQDIDKILYGA